MSNDLPEGRFREVRGEDGSITCIANDQFREGNWRMVRHETRDANGFNTVQYIAVEKLNDVRNTLER